MKIIIVGGTGFIGKHLCRKLTQLHHHVTVLTRNPETAKKILMEPIDLSNWDPLKFGTPEKELEGADAVINLAGASIAEGRWTRSRKQILYDSRINTTHRLVTALSNLPVTIRPKVLINASGIGYYGLDTPQDVDETANSGKGFLSDLCIQWEKEACRASDYGIRTICLRIGMVLGKDGGALQKMLLPFKLFLGGPIGDGTQPVSWIHIEDLCHLIETSIENNVFKGQINACSPHIVTMKEFCETLGKSLGRPSWLPIPALALKVGLGEMSTLMTHGQRAVPATAQKLGFVFKYPSLNSAMNNLFQKGILSTIQEN
jgi:uncharacterized protein (TIGR01777 family)